MSKYRKFKGNPILKKLQNYTVVDIETTGLVPDVDEIIEIGAMQVRENVITNEFCMLSKPKNPIPDFITAINGITNEMVKEAPPISEVLPQFLDFIKDDIVVGFNTSFDVNFIYDECDRINLKFSNNYVDVRKIAKIVIPDFKEKTRRRYKLKNLVWYFKFGKQVHRALSDCEYTKLLYDKLNEIANEKSLSYEQIKIRNPWDANDIKRENTDITLFSGERFVFTGKLQHMTRKEAMQYVVNYGGSVGDSLTKDTDYLVMGTQDYSKIIGNKSSKQLKAEKYISEGEDINIITEEVFYDMINFEPSEQEYEEKTYSSSIGIEITPELVFRSYSDEDIRGKIIELISPSFSNQKLQEIKNMLLGLNREQLIHLLFNDFEMNTSEHANSV